MAKKTPENNVNLSDEQIKAIQNYGNEIKTLKDFVEAVRKRPGMYIGYKGNLGLIRMIREVFQNAIDEVVRIDSPCNRVVMSFDERNLECVIGDNGRGIPYGNIIRIFTSQHTSSNYEKKLYDYTSGTNGVGSKITNALSRYFTVDSYILGEGRRVEFYEGYPWDKGEVVIPNKEGYQGTTISFAPSAVMGQITVTADDVMRMVSSILPLTPIGTRIYFTSIRLDGTVQDTILENVEGLYGLLNSICPKPMFKTVTFGMDNGEYKGEVLFSYDLTENGEPEILATYSNFCPTDTKESSHVKGFISGLRKFFVNYMNNVYLNSAAGNKKKSLTIIESDIRMGLRAVINCACLEPNFTGQAKDILSVDEMEKFMFNLTYKSLEEWAKANPQSLQKLCKYFKEIASIRASVDNKKVKLQNQYTSSANGLPSKFIPPTKKKVEFYICEGDSAGGSFENWRVNETQGCFPIRGNILNVFDKTESVALQNPEVAGILAIIGGGYGRNFDIDKVPWDKVISACDADDHGAGINALILRLVLRFCPDLIKAGKFYRAVPPLYQSKKGKQKLYFTDRLQLVEYVQKEFAKSHTITTMQDKKLSARDVVELLYTNIDYAYELEKVANLYHIKPEILEIYLVNRHKSEKDVCKAIKQRYRFMEMTQINGHTVCDGPAEGKNNTIILGDRTLNECADIIEILSKNYYTEYKVDGQPATILDIMKLYDKCQPDITRLKGLGESNGDELAEYLIFPGDMGNRTLIQYTMEDAIKEIEQIRYYENNKNKLLENIKVTRLDVMD